MKTRSIIGIIVVAVLLVAACATPGPSVGEVAADLDLYTEGDVQVSGTVARGVPVAGTQMYVYQFAGEGSTVAVLSPHRPTRGDSRVVSGRVVPFSGEVTDEITEAVSDHLATVGEVPDTALEAATGQSTGLIRTFTLANNAEYFLLED